MNKNRQMLYVAMIGLLVLNLSDAIAAEIPPKAGQVTEIEITENVTMKFCWIPAGENHLGSTKEEQRLVLNAFKKVRLEPKLIELESNETRGMFKTQGFWLGKFEVTQAQWEAVMGNNPSFFNSKHEAIKRASIENTNNFPVERVSWDDCQEFMVKLNKMVKLPSAIKKGEFSLPHEDQWEYACRGGKSGQMYYCDGELSSKKSNCDGENPLLRTAKGPFLERTTEVGAYEKNAPHPWGLCDMAGNVSEWCSNWYDETKKERVRRGGLWAVDPICLRSASRDRFPPNSRSDGVGLRVILLPK